MDKQYYPEGRREDFEDQAGSIKAKLMLLRQRTENQRSSDAESDELNKPRTKKNIVDFALTLLLTVALYIISMIAVDVLPQYEAIINAANRYRIYVLVAIPLIYVVVTLIVNIRRWSVIRRNLTESRDEWSDMVDQHNSLAMRWIEMDDRERAQGQAGGMKVDQEKLERMVNERIEERIKRGELAYPQRREDGHAKDPYEQMRNTGPFARVQQSAPQGQPMQQTMQQGQMMQGGAQPPMQRIQQPQQQQFTGMPYGDGRPQQRPPMDPRMQMRQGMSQPVQRIQTQQGMSQPVPRVQAQQGMGQPAPGMQMRQGMSQPVPQIQMQQGMGQPQMRPQQQRPQQPGMPTYVGQPQYQGHQPGMQDPNAQSDFFGTGPYGQPGAQGFAYPPPPTVGGYPGR